MPVRYTLQRRVAPLVDRLVATTHYEVTSAPATIDSWTFLDIHTDTETGITRIPLVSHKTCTT